MASLVVVASFPTSHEAALARTRLGEHGIPAVVHGEHHTRLFAGAGAAAGTVDVLVHPDDEDAARGVLALDVSGYDEFLTSLEAEGAADEERESFDTGKHCPRCGSRELTVKPFSAGAQLLGILLLGIPLLFMKRQHECDICGLVWKD